MNRINELFNGIVRNAKRVCKARVPSSLEVRAEVEVNLIEYFNELSVTINRVNVEDPEEARQLRSIFSSARTKLVRSFAKLNLRYKVPSVIGQEIDLLILTSDSESGSSSDSDNGGDMNQTEFANFVNGTVKPFDGKPENLQSFLDQTNLIVTVIPQGSEAFALALVKTKLIGDARTLVTDDLNTIQGIQNVLRENLRMNPSSFYINKMKLSRQGGKDSSRYAQELEELSNCLQRAYISEGFTLANAQVLTKNALVDSVKVNASNNTTQLAMQLMTFNSVTEVLDKVVSQPRENVNAVMFTRINNNRPNNNNNRGSDRGRNRNNGYNNNNNGRNGNNNNNNYNNRNRGNNNNGQNRNNNDNNNYRGNNNNNRGNGNRGNYRGNRQGNNYQNFYVEGSENSSNPQASNLGAM